jgi:hypothetical protein
LPAVYVAAEAATYKTWGDAVCSRVTPFSFTVKVRNGSF